MKSYYIALSLFFSFFLSTVFSQIPNFSFENWTTVGSYSVPDNWDNLNSTTAPASVYTCTKGTPGNPGTSYMKLTSKTVSGVGVVPGVAVCGILDHATHLPVSGFPFTDRPQKLTGNWQYMMYGTGKGHIDVFLTHWNSVTHSRDTIAGNRVTLSGMVMAWAVFTLPLTYLSSSYPDSCTIFLSASGTPAANLDFLWVDNLNFSGSVSTGINPIRNTTFTVFPNPATDLLNINCFSEKSEELGLKLFDQNGLIVLESKKQLLPGENKVALNVSAVPKGIYLLLIEDEKSVKTEKVVIQ